MKKSRKRHEQDAFGEGSYSSDDGSVGGGARSSKRFVWSDELHQDFVSVIFDIGLKSALNSIDIPNIAELLDHKVSEHEIHQHIKEYIMLRNNSRESMRTNRTNGKLGVLPGEYSEGLSIVHQTMQGHFLKNFFKSEYGLNFFDASTDVVRSSKDEISNRRQLLSEIYEMHFEQFKKLQSIVGELRDLLASALPDSSPEVIQWLPTCSPDELLRNSFSSNEFQPDNP